MTNQNQHTAGSRALQNDRETRGKHWPIMALVLSAVLDRAITLLHFESEGNPLVTHLGPLPWVALTAGLLVGAAVIWYRFEIYTIRVMKWWVIIGAGVTFLAFVTNVYVVYLL